MRRDLGTRQLWAVLAIALPTAPVAIGASAAATAPVVPPAPSIYLWEAPGNAGAVQLAHPGGGEYIYSDRDPQDGRPIGRFVFGKPARTEYILFSAEEEDALWHLRQSLLAPEPEVPTPRRPKRPQGPSLAGIVWPKVIATDEKVCVPQLAYAQAADRTQHLSCWLKETKRVE